VNRDAAEAARHLGALAFLDNTEEALRWYRRAVELDPANADEWNWLGLLYYRTGQLDQRTELIGRSSRSVRRTVTGMPLLWAPATSG
jgi:TPR repeat protein